MAKYIFENFSEYWHYAKYLSENQRKIIFKNLTSKQKSHLDTSFISDGWNDVFYRNEIDEKIDEMTNLYGYNIIDIRIKALKGKSVYVPLKFWTVVEETFGKYKMESVDFILSGVKSHKCKTNENVCLIFHENFEKFVEK